MSVSDFKLLLSDVNDPTAIFTIEHNVSVDYIFFSSIFFFINSKTVQSRLSKCMYILLRG